MAKSDNSRDLSEFQIRNIKILSFLLRKDVATDEMIDYLREIELDYYGLEEKNGLLEELSNIDEKTRLLKYKKDYLTNILKTTSRIYQGMEEKHYDVSLVRFDIDDFSLFNNRYGHDVGDRILVEVAMSIKKASRPTDYTIRFGGEEFDVLLPATPVSGAVCYVERFFDLVHKIRVPYEGEDLKVTLSAGISSMEYTLSEGKYIDSSEGEKDYLRLQKQADDALYLAKSKGKDCYRIYDPRLQDRYRKVRKEYAKS